MFAFSSNRFSLTVVFSIASALTISSVARAQQASERAAPPAHVDDGVDGNDEDEEARALFEAGRVAYDAARFDDALQNFLHAYEISHRPGLLFNIGLAHERLGNDEAAVDAFDRYLAQTSDDPERSQVERRVAVDRCCSSRRRNTATSEDDAPPPRASDGSPIPWIVLAGGGALVVGGAIALVFGISERGAVQGAADGELDWVDAESRLSTSDVLSVVGAVGLGVGAALMLTSIVLFQSDGGDEGVTVSMRGTTLSVGGRW